jgi:cyclin-dependent kinase
MALKVPLFTANSEHEQIEEIFKLLGTPNDLEWPGVS